MADAGVRIALLARAGKARDQLHAALNEAGATIVAEGDPAQLEPAQVASHQPNFFLVSLEPAMEASLERFDDLFAGPDVEVMFDDAEVTSTLDGWDLNRWARHLANKVLSTVDLLPPVPAGSPAWASFDGAAADAGDVEVVLGDDDEDDDLSDSVSLDSAATSTDGGLDLDLSGIGLSESDLQLPASAADEPAIPEFGELEFDESVSISRFDPSTSDNGELDLDVAELAAQLEAFDKNESRFLHEADLPTPDVRQSVDELIASVGAQGIEEIDAFEAEAAPEPEPESAPAAPAVAAAAAPAFDFSNLELAPIDDAPPAAAPAESATMVPREAGLGALVVLAGLGGPDAVRQLLSSLPSELAVPVLLYQHLEVGKHERLVDQLAKISRLPVVLATTGARPESGKVNLLPSGCTVRADNGGLCFESGPLAQLLATIAPQDSLVMALSGTDVQLVPAILAVRDGGGMVLAQDPDVCFDAAAAEALQREGAQVFPALGLARQVAARWPN